MVIASKLHLESLEIEGFRGIDKLTIPRLGRVTLLVGKNGVGKTTVLDAVEIYVADTTFTPINHVLVRRGDVRILVDKQGSVVVEPDWRALFYGRNADGEERAVIGPIDSADHCLVVKPTLLSQQQFEALYRLEPSISDSGPVLALKAEFRGKERVTPALFSKSNEGVAGAFRNLESSLVWQATGFVPSNVDRSRATVCVYLGPDALDTEDLARFWDTVVLSSHERMAVSALEGVVGTQVQGVAVVGGNPGTGEAARRLMVKLNTFAEPVPLLSLGGGAARLFGVALALANAKDGFLLIDEAENGIYYSLQEDFWRMVIDTAERLNVQVVATTHSWDCVRGFARALDAVEGADGMLYRIQRSPAGLGAVPYGPDNLRVAADQTIEVR